MPSSSADVGLLHLLFSETVIPGEPIENHRECVPCIPDSVGRVWLRVLADRPQGLEVDRPVWVLARMHLFLASLMAGGYLACFGRVSVRDRSCFILGFQAIPQFQSVVAIQPLIGAFAWVIFNV